jgi:3-deoxy-D-arabino-heptulosonate 7-phosphate (DAHP) synthase
MHEALGHPGWLHDDPEHAVSDGAQTITPGTFEQLISADTRSPAARREARVRLSP